jgi:hypothetical protein
VAIGVHHVDLEVAVAVGVVGDLRAVGRIRRRALGKHRRHQRAPVAAVGVHDVEIRGGAAALRIEHDVTAVRRPARGAIANRRPAGDIPDDDRQGRRGDAADGQQAGARTERPGKSAAPRPVRGAALLAGLSQDRSLFVMCGVLGAFVLISSMIKHKST